MATSTPLIEPTISDTEQAIETGLEALRNAPLNSEITAALRFLAPSGYRPVVQLEEDGRKKRSTASASNWSPETGEVRIYFELIEPRQAAAPQIAPQKRTNFDRWHALQEETNKGLRHDPRLMVESERKLSSERRIRTALGEAVEPLVSEDQIRELCVALAESEKAGRAFIALKRFRDEELTTHSYDWVRSLAHRQAVLARAIDAGAVLTSPVPNPKAPQHPTTTVKLNRDSEYANTVPPRYQPVHAKDGASASEIILRDRGRF